MIGEATIRRVHRQLLDVSILGSEVSPEFVERLTQNSATPIAPEREVTRCNRCKLNQFITRDGYCRRCAHPLRIAVAVLAMRPKPAGDMPRVAGLGRAAGNFGATVALLRRALNLSQRKLANVLGCQRSYISKVENGGAVPTLDTISRFASAFGTTPFVMVTLAEL